MLFNSHQMLLMSQLNWVLVFQWKWLDFVTNIWLLGKKTSMGLLERDFEKPILSYLNRFQKRKLYIIAEGWFQWIPVRIVLFETKNSYYSKTFLHRNQAQPRLWFVRLLFKNNKRNDKCFNNHSYSLLGGATTSISHFSVCSAICLSCTISQEPYII